MSDIYVVVTSNDGVEDELGPIVFEQYTRFASLEEIRERAKALEGRYGPCRIAKLEFVDEP